MSELIDAKDAKDAKDEDFLIFCIIDGDLFGINYCINCLGISKDTVFKCSKTPLIYAVEYNNLMIIAVFLNNKVNINHKDANGNDALYYSLHNASFTGNYYIPDLLIEYGADINNSLAKAIHQGNKDMIEYLLIKYLII
jgi:ankyrin repeat protein